MTERQHRGEKGKPREGCFLIFLIPLKMPLDHSVTQTQTDVFVVGVNADLPSSHFFPAGLNEKATRLQ